MSETLERIKSREVYDRSCRVIPGGVNSPVRSFNKLGLHPMIAESGRGDCIRDIDGNEYIDFCCSWGSLILGHAHPTIVQATYEQLQRGSSFGISTEIEEKIATQIVSLMPNIEKIRFVNSGTEATMTAMRLSRGFTGRSKIIKFSGHYHGHCDSLLIQAGSGVASLNSLATSKGVHPSILADTLCFPFNDFDAVRSFFRANPMALDVAGVILEPVTGNMGVVLPEPGFLKLLREETTRIGALLIFDEVITGFRVGLGGAQELYHIQPDLTCLGKVIGGGFPVAAVGGRADILDCLAPLGEVYQAGTLSGNPVAMRAGYETLCLIQKSGFYEELERKTERIVAPLRKAIERARVPITLNRCGSMFNLFFGVSKVFTKDDVNCRNDELFNRFFRYLFRRGVYISPSPQEAWFISAVHTDENIDRAAQTMIEFIESL
jgi:glutamate-1-semialdehyde 2,1-aminomutase